MGADIAMPSWLALEMAAPRLGGALGAQLRRSTDARAQILLAEATRRAPSHAALWVARLQRARLDAPMLHRLHLQMRAAGVVPTSYAFNLLAHAALRAGQLTRARALLQQAAAAGRFVRPLTLTRVLEATVRQGELGAAHALSTLLWPRALPLLPTATAALMQAYAQRPRRVPAAWAQAALRHVTPQALAGHSALRVAVCALAGRYALRAVHRRLVACAERIDASALNDLGAAIEARELARKQHRAQLKLASGAPLPEDWEEQHIEAMLDAQDAQDA